jgi:hypothetical protein
MEATAGVFDLARCLGEEEKSRFILVDEVATSNGVSKEEVLIAVGSPSSGRAFTHKFAVAGGCREITHVAWVPDMYGEAPPAPGRATERGKQASPLRERRAKTPKTPKRERSLPLKQGALEPVSANKREKKKVNRGGLPTASVVAAPQLRHTRVIVESLTEPVRFDTISEQKRDEMKLSSPTHCLGNRTSADQTTRAGHEPAPRQLGRQRELRRGGPRGHGLAVTARPLRDGVRERKGGPQPRRLGGGLFGVPGQRGPPHEPGRVAGEATSARARSPDPGDVIFLLLEDVGSWFSNPATTGRLRGGSSPSHTRKP